MSNEKKICIVVTSLGKGGAERSSALLSQLLSDLGYEIYIVTIMDNINNSFSGTLLNLGKITSRLSILKKVKKYKAFKRYLKLHDFDVIIDNRSRPNLIKELIVSKWLYKADKIIYCVRSYNLKTYFPPIKPIVKCLYPSAFKIVAVSKAIQDAIETTYGFENVMTIYNPVPQIEVKQETINNLPEGYILYFGRIIDEVKNISLLIESYKMSVLPKQNISLVILGDGKDLKRMKLKVKAIGLENNVIFIPFTEDPFYAVQNAKFTVLTSRYEGFPRTVLESLAIGTPVISVDCKSGPSEMITEAYNGLLVENYNPQALAHAMNRFIDDTSLYAFCKANAQASVRPFSIDAIAKAWQNVLN
ncbi:glycosyltransferase [Psychroserpens sp. MEBiC05023]